MRDQKPRLRKFACLAAIAAMLALSGRAAEMDLDDQLLVRLPAPPEGRRAPLQVMDGNYQRLSGVCPWWNAMVARQCLEFDSREKPTTADFCFGSFVWPRTDDFRSTPL
jgi:hypothetical protein